MKGLTLVEVGCVAVCNKQGGAGNSVPAAGGLWDGGEGIAGRGARQKGSGVVQAGAQDVACLSALVKEEAKESTKGRPAKGSSE